MKLEKIPKRVSVEYNPEYGADYAEGGMKDRNDSYSD